MKKTVKTLLMIFAVAFGVLLMNGTESKAAITSVTQTEARDQSISLQWSAELGADFYVVKFSNDNVNWIEMDHTSSTENRVTGLAANSAYYARVEAYSGSYYDDDKVLISTSPVITVATLGELTNLVQTSATTNSITLSWNKVPTASGYQIWYHDGNASRKIAATTGNSYTISGLVTGAEYRLTVIPYRQSGAVQAIGDVPTYSYLDFEGYKTAPSKVIGLYMSNYWEYLGETQYSWTKSGNADGYQIQLSKVSGKLITQTETSSTYASVKPYVKGVATKARVRAYISIGGKKIYGAWSDYNYNAAAKKVTIKSKNRKITVSWKKITGVKNYTVYISSKSSTSGFKKVKKLGAKKKSIVIKKCGKKKLKKGKTYYIKVVYGIKAGKKTVTSKIVSKGSIYVY